MKDNKTAENNKVEDSDKKVLEKSEKVETKEEKVESKGNTIEEKETKNQKKKPKEKKIKTSIKKRFKKRHIILLLIIAYIIYRLVTKGNSIIPEIEQISKVERRDIATSISATGTVQSIDSKDVSETTMAGMTVEDVRVKEGDVINTGDIICTFNTDTLKSTLAQLKSSTSGLSGLSGLNTNGALNSGVSEIAKQSVEEAKKAYEQSNSSLETTKSQLKDAKKELESYKPTYDAASKKFEPIKNAYNQKEEDYNSAVEDRQITETDYTIAETEYYKYYHRSDPTKLRDEYADPSDSTKETPKAEYLADIQKAKTNLNNAEKARDNATIIENQKLKDLQTYQRNTYNPAYNEFSPIELKYNQLKGNVDALEAQKSALESSTASLKSTYQSLNTLASSTNSSIYGADLSSLNGDMSSLNSQIAQMQKQIDNAVVKSPVSGIVTAIGVSSGDTYTGSTIVRIENCQAFEIEAYIDEYDIPDVKKDMSVKIKTDATRDEVLNGKITYVAISSASISSGMDLSALAGGMGSYSSLSSSTGGGKASYKIKVDINTPNDRLRAGMNAKLSIITGEEKNILSVPYESIFERDDGTSYIKVVKPEYDINANITKANEKYQKFTQKDINVEGSSTIKVLSDSLENNIEELDIKVGIEGTYYTQVISDQVSENTYVIVPKADSDNSLTQLFELMGADAGV